MVDIAPDWIAVHAVLPLHAEETRVRAECGHGAAGALHIARPVALVGPVVPEELIGTLTNVVRAGLAHVIHIAVLFVRVRSVRLADAEGRVVVLLRRQHLARALHLDKCDQNFMFIN